MKRKRAVVWAAAVMVCAGFTSGRAAAQTEARTVPQVTVIRCAALLDGKSQQVRRNVEIVVEGDKIKEVRNAGPSTRAEAALARDDNSTPGPSTRAEAALAWDDKSNAGPSTRPAKNAPDSLGMTNSSPSSPSSATNPGVVEISGTCMPGLIDTHTHVLLQGDITAAEYDEQLLKESAAYRVLRAARAARLALEYGFTTLRDVETEGAGYADVDLKRAIERGIVPGPRMQVATRSLNVTGAYPIQGYNWELTMPSGVQVCDGADGCRKAVREQIAHGADWIKLYSDRSYYIDPNPPRGVGPAPVLNDVPTFTMDELRAIVDEAHRQRRPVASHASALQGVHNSIEAGVDSIEHGQYIADADLQTMKQRGTWYVPTLYVGEYVAEGRAKTGAKVWLDMVKIHADTFRRAVQAGVKIAFGTDAGGFSWDVNPAVEFPLMVKYGMTPAQAIDAAHMKAAELLRMQDRIGSIEAGKLADIVAVPGDPLADITQMEKVNFVMKGGIVYKK